MKSSQQMYQEIQPLIENRWYGAAISALKSMLEVYPEHPTAHTDLGALYHKTGDKERALDHYGKSVQLQPENINFQKNLADFYFTELGNAEAAMQIYEKILTIDPNDIQTLMIVGHISVSLHRFQDAKDKYRRVLEIEPWNVDARQYLKAVENHEKSGVARKTAEDMYQEIEPLIRDGRHEAAISTLEKLLEAHPGFALAHNDLGVLYYQQGDKPKAQTHYEKAVQLQPDNFTFQKNLADFYFVELNRVKEAMDLYYKVLEANPEDVETLLTAGHISVALQRFDDAKLIYNRVLEIEPWNADARQFLEGIEKHEGKKGNAKTAEARYHEMEPLRVSGQPEAAIEALEDLLEKYPEFALAHNDLGVLYYKQGDKIKSQKHYEKAAELQPENITFQKNLADFYFVELDRVKEAMDIYYEVLKKNPEDVETLMTAGHISVALQRFDDARLIYNRVLEIEPWNANARHYLDALENQENVDPASDYFAKAN